MNRKPTVKEYITAAGSLLPAILKGIANRLKLWATKHKGCLHCCIICKYFNECKNDF